MRKFQKATVGIITAGLLVAGLAACSSTTGADSGSKASTKPSASASTPDKPIASIASLSGVDTAVLLDAGFAAALKTLGLTPGTDGTATLTDGSLHFPITGGNVDYYSPTGNVHPYVVGSIKHDGSGFSLTAGATKVDLTNFTIDPGKSLLYGDVAVNGTNAVMQAPIFNLDGRTLEPLKKDGDNAILTGTKVKISSAAADLLNKTFKTDAVKPGLLVGIATITIATK